jgi:uncharacterized protein (TIGR03435 family)
MRRAVISSGVFVLTLGILACALTFGQTADSNLTFEVASVKLDAPDAPRIGTQGGPGTRDPERFSGRGMPLRLYLCLAYATADCQEQISGPGWIDSEKYDVEVKIPPGTTQEQYQKMLQNLLTDRFKLVLHRETRVRQVYELVVAKDGPKFKESVAPSGDAPAPGPPQAGLRPERLPRAAAWSAGVYQLVWARRAQPLDGATADHGGFGKIAEPSERRGPTGDR